RRAARKIRDQWRDLEGSSSEGRALRVGRKIGHSVAKTANENQSAKTRIGNGIQLTLGSSRLLVLRRLVCVFHASITSARTLPSCCRLPPRFPKNNDVP